MKKAALTAALVVAIAFSITGCSKKSKEGSAPGDSTDAALAGSGTVVVKVDGTPVTMRDVKRQEEMLMQQLQAYADSAQIAAMKPTMLKQAADNAINRILLENAVDKLGIKADQKTIDERTEYYRKNFVSEEAFNADLANRGITPDQFKKEIEIGIQAEDLFGRQTTSMKPVTEQEVRLFYDNNKERFLQPERVRASHILLTTNKDDADTTRARKKAEAQRILGELKKGADFAETARKYSGCPSKEQGGDLGFFERGRMVPAFETAAFGLKKGQMSGVVETQFGYHIIKVTDRASASTAPFDQAKQNIEQYLGQQKRQQVITAFFDSLRSAAKVEYLDSSLAH